MNNLTMCHKNSNKKAKEATDFIGIERTLKEMEVGTLRMQHKQSKTRKQAY